MPSVLFLFPCPPIGCAPRRCKQRALDHAFLAGDLLPGMASTPGGRLRRTVSGVSKKGSKADTSMRAKIKKVLSIAGLLVMGVVFIFVGSKDLVHSRQLAALGKTTAGRVVDSEDVVSGRFAGAPSRELDRLHDAWVEHRERGT